MLGGWLVLLLGCETHPGSAHWGETSTVGAATATVAGQAVQPPPPGAQMMPAVVGPPPDPNPADLIYRIGPYDTLRVDVFGVPELSADADVNLQGLIVLPLIGPVSVSGLTPNEAEAAIVRQLAGRYLRDPRVTVYVKSSASLNVTVSGWVGKQGVQPIQGRKTLSDILAQAGGVSPMGKKGQVVLYRGNEPGRASGDERVTAYVIDYQAILDGKLHDPLVVGADRIYVPASGVALFFSPIANVLQTWVRPFIPLP
ncbi:polysaccharide biosynthesis/export family protein [uncultured Thiodictyon sp.]|nr:polysaccharide biosynthesis/export family protein [uncultured Thiodictyon sp.]